MEIFYNRNNHDNSSENLTHAAVVAYTVQGDIDDWNSPDLLLSTRNTVMATENMLGLLHTA